jgi:hypothetical protein
MNEAEKAKARFEDRFISEPNSGCWLWLGADRFKHGYGTFYFNERRELAHRFAWMLFRGEIPVGICVLHKCDNTRCVNPDHLFLGTHAENMKDMRVKGRHRYGISPKLNLEEILIIRKSTASQRQLAREFGIGSSHVWRIKNRKHWIAM